MSPLAGSHSLPEVIFLVEEAPEGGFTARALSESIIIETDDLAELHAMVREGSSLPASTRARRRRSSSFTSTLTKSFGDGSRIAKHRSNLRHGSEGAAQIELREVQVA